MRQTFKNKKSTKTSEKPTTIPSEYPSEFIKKTQVKHQETTKSPEENLFQVMKRMISG